MSKRLSSACCLSLCTLLAAGGCGLEMRRRPYDQEVEAFIQRREFALAQTGRIRPPMAGTSYTGITEDRHKDPARGEYLISPPHEHLRQGVRQNGRWAVQHNPGLEFDVTLSDELIKNEDIGRIADRLNRHYAAELVQHGWYLAGFTSGGNGSQEAHRYWATYVWSDLGRGQAATPQKGLSVNYTYNSNDMRQGFFTATIAVCADTASQRAHVIMSLDESLGL